MKHLIAKTKTMTNRILLISLFLMHFMQVTGQQPVIQFSHLSIRDGLPHNQINCIYKDSKSRVWFGTIAGLARFDGNEFKIYKSRAADSTSIGDNDIRSIIEGPDGMLWVESRVGFEIYDPKTDKFDRNVWDNLRGFSIPEDNVKAIKKGKSGYWLISKKTGLYYCDNKTKKAVYIGHILNNGHTIDASTISDVTEGVNNQLWIVHVNGGIEILDQKTHRVVRRINVFSNRNVGSEIDSYRIFIDRQGEAWLYDNAGSSGVYRISPKNYEIFRITKSSPGIRLNSNMVAGIIQDRENRIWVATDHGGINIIDKSTRSVKYIVNKDDDAKSLSQNNISSIYFDNSGTVWIGTYRRGVNYFHPGVVKFEVLKHEANSNSLIYNDVNAMVDDGAGNLWIGTNGKGLSRYNLAAKTFTHFQHQQGSENSLSNDAIVRLYTDRQRKLWIGTYAGGLDFFENGKFSHYRNDITNKNSLSDNRVSGMLEDSQQRFWVITMGGGINLFDRKNGRFKALTVQTKEIQSNYVFDLIEDTKGNIWFGTGYGLTLFEKTSGKFKTFRRIAGNTNSLINNSINTLEVDTKGRIWIGTREGLSVYDHGKGKFQNYTVESGLPDNNIQSIERISDSEFWVGTSNGLSKILVSGQNDIALRFVNFDESDGLQGKEFNRNASAKLSNGMLAFGGADGINIFNPSNIRTIKENSRLVFTDLFLFNKEVNVDEKIDGTVVLPTVLSSTKQITLKSYQNVFSIGFTSLNYIEPHKVKYQYMMDGFDKEWVPADNKLRKATYTNLDPGTYTFKVRASDADGLWKGKPIELQIRILPPFYKSSIAYLIYIFLFGSSLYLIRRRGIQKIRSQFEAEQEKKEIQRIIEQERLEVLRVRELDAMKIKFLTNISHEFRTPLALIMAPIEKMRKLAEADSNLGAHITMIQRNARRLLNLVNQLLDLRRMELKELTLQGRKGDLVPFVKEIVHSFKDLAEQKNIELIFTSGLEQLNISFDHEKIERILFNLLSNAFKFTYQDGKIAVSLEVSLERETIEVAVSDNGIGIPLENQDRVFDSFFQNDIPESIINQGSGIGLSISLEFAKLHGGDIKLESEIGVGSCFTLVIPLEHSALQHDKHEEKIAEVNVHDHAKQQLLKKNEQSAKKYTVLIVEDDPDFRFYLKENLSEKYNLIEASNGKSGWQKALFYHPNIVVSDVSMPEMDGLELCKKIKGDDRTMDVPVVLLTANNDHEHQVSGLASGANDYITKPFSFEILISKLDNLLYQQESFKKTYKKTVEVKPLEIVVETPDEKFLQEVVHHIEKNISNVNFSVDELSSLVLVSRVTLYKRIVNLTGKTPLDFIKSYRLKRAAQLLEKNSFTISQICYKVGFKTTKNFVKSFKAEFNVIPSRYLESKNGESSAAEDDE